MAGHNTKSKLVVFIIQTISKSRDKLLGQGIVDYSENKQPEKTVDNIPKNNLLELEFRILLF